MKSLILILTLLASGTTFADTLKYSCNSSGQLLDAPQIDLYQDSNSGLYAQITGFGVNRKVSLKLIEKRNGILVYKAENMDIEFKIREDGTNVKLTSGTSTYTCQ